MFSEISIEYPHHVWMRIPPWRGGFSTLIAISVFGACANENWNKPCLLPWKFWRHSDSMRVWTSTTLVLFWHWSRWKGRWRWWGKAGIPLPLSVNGPRSSSMFCALSGLLHPQTQLYFFREGRGTRSVGLGGYAALSPPARRVPRSHP